MAKWHWIVRARRNEDKEWKDYDRGYTKRFGPYIYSEGDIEGTRQDAINRAKRNISSYKQIIEVKRVK